MARLRAESAVPEEAPDPFDWNSEVIDNGDGVRFDLQWLSTYDGGHNPFDYLQLVRTRSLVRFADVMAIEENYWSRLPSLRESFATYVQGEFDLIIDVPSNSGYHRPYLSALLAKRAGLRCVGLLKSTHHHAAPEKFAALLAACTFVKDHDANLGSHHSVLIVDDVYSTGTTARVTITKLLGAGLPRDASIRVACPLRVSVDPYVKDVCEMMSASKGM